MQDLMQRRGTSLDRMQQLDTAFGRPSLGYRKIHVAGTNGKGSVSTKIASALTQLGYRTGLYTSPHIYTFHERIQIDGVPISVEESGHLLSKILEISREPTFFEVVTMLAFLYFQNKKVDFAVIETGLGGTLDPTNIITPELSVITSISFDHMNVLGNTIEEIASNKAGIIKAQAGVVISHRAALRAVFDKAFQERVPMYVMPPREDWMEENAEIAKKVISLLFPMAPELDFSALPPCRFEVMEIDGLTQVFDIAHNQDGLERLFIRLDKVYPNRPKFVLFGISQDKDLSYATQLLKERASQVFCFDTENPRLVRRDELRVALGSEWTDLEGFLSLARQEHGVVVITGSAYLMKDAKERLALHLQGELQDRDLGRCHALLPG